MAAGNIGFTVPHTLSQVVTSDLVGTFEKFKLLSVTAVFTKQVDPGNSGIANNTQATICVANDLTGNTVSPTNISDPGAYANHKTGTLVSGREFRYTYTPKVVDMVNNAGTSIAAGTFAQNPWLLLSSTGISIPHQRLRAFVDSTNASDTSVINVYYEYKFMVAGLQ